MSIGEVPFTCLPAMVHGFHSVCVPRFVNDKDAMVGAMEMVADSRNIMFNVGK